MAKSLDVQVGGNHYKDMKMQPVQLVADLGLDFFSGNILKYISRYQNKNGLEDLKKAQHYARLRMDLLPDSKVIYEDEVDRSLAILGKYCVVNNLEEKVYIILCELILGSIDSVIYEIDKMIESKYGNKNDRNIRYGCCDECTSAALWKRGKK